MRLPDKLHISWQNEVGNYTLTPSVAAESAYPITRMQSSLSNKKSLFDMTGEARQSISFTDSTERTVTVAGIHSHNCPDGTTIRWRFYAGESEAGKLERDTGMAYAVLDGVADYITTPDAAIPAGTVYRFCVAVKPDDVTPAALEALYTKSDSGDSNITFEVNLNTDGTINFTVTTDGSTVAGNSIDSSIAPTFPDTVNAIMVEWNSVSGVATWYQYNSNVDGYDELVDAMDYEYLIANSLFEQFGETDTTSATGTPFDGNELFALGASFSSGTPQDFFDGNAGRAAAYCDGVIFNDIDARRYVDADPAPTTMTTETGATATIVSAPPITEVGRAVTHNVPFGSIIAGINPIEGDFEDSDGRKTHYSDWFESANFKSGRVDIENTSGFTNDQLIIDKMWFGFAYGPEYGHSHNWSAVTYDSTRNQRKPGGMESIKGEVRRGLQLDLRMFENYERQVLRFIQDQAAKYGDQLWTTDPNDTLSQRYETTSIYRRMDDMSIEGAFYNGNNMQYMLEEN